MNIKKTLKKILPQKIIVMMIKNKRSIYNFLKRNENLITEKEASELDRIKNEFPIVLTTSDTLEYIIKNKASMCRYGDAEFDISNQENNNDAYQTPSDKLSERLHNIIKHGSGKGLIVCIPPFNSETNNIKHYHGELSFWEWYWLNKFNKIKPLIEQNCYGNSFTTRESVFYENKLTDIKKIWDNRHVVFVYGKNGRFNSEHSIFNNINKKDEILVSPTSAFNDYSNIIEKCLKYRKNVLFMIAAGPTATVLAFDLWKAGYQALDIGHLPNSYDEYKGVIVSPEDIPLVKM